jgi:putative flippase GtrA
VSLVSRWYQRFQRLIHEFAKFGVIGTIGFLVTEGVFNLMIARHQPTFTANAVSTLVAAAVTFVGNRYWTFRHRERTGMAREAVVFLLLNLVGIGIQQACLEIAKHDLGRHDKLTLNAAFLVGVALATLFRFWSYRKWVWLAQVSDQAPAVPGALERVPEAEHEAWEPALVPHEHSGHVPGGGPERNSHAPDGGPERNSHVPGGGPERNSHAPDGGPERNGYAPDGPERYGTAPGAAERNGHGQADLPRPPGPRHARSGKSSG